MLGRLFKTRRQSGGNPAALYGAIVAQARSPVLYARLGVADTVEGRFEMIVLHLILVLRQLRGATTPAETTGQETFDLFCQDMDRSLREMGVGDLSVPKRMRKIGESFYGRAAAYEPGLTAGDVTELAGAIGRNVWPEGDRAGGAAALAAYAIAAVGTLGALETSELVAGRVVFPDVSDFAPAEVSS
jgi:cytochrome b pre-mRNA-processing protein 3